MAEQNVQSREWMSRIEALVRQAESLPDPASKRTITDLLNAVIEFHGAALDKLLEIAVPLAGEPFLAELAKDELISSMLLLHGLHPDDLETRVQRAIDRLQFRFQPWGANVHLVSIDRGVVRVRYESKHGASADTAQTIESALYDAAPDLEGVIVEGVAAPATNGFIPLSSIASHVGAR